MLDLLNNLKSSLRWMDLLDVVIVAFIVYRVLLLIKGTRAMQMLTGLAVIGIVFFVSVQLELFTTHWLLSYFFDYLILIVIVLFQDDLRRALTFMGTNPFFSGSTAQAEREMVDEIARAAHQLARERTGALIVIERETGLKNFIETGSKLDARVKSELITSIFAPTSPIHDGAVIISSGRIAAAGCFLPLSKDTQIDKRFGTRHRAAIGLTEETDAIVVLVSEEAGEAHLVKNGTLTTNLNEQEIRQSLQLVLDMNFGIPEIPKNINSKVRNWLKVLSKKEDE